MKDSPTGRVIDYENFRRQEEMALMWHRRMIEVFDRTPSVKKVGPDCYEITGADYASLEQRIMAAMDDTTDYSNARNDGHGKTT